MSDFMAVIYKKDDFYKIFISNSNCFIYGNAIHEEAIKNEWAPENIMYSSEDCIHSVELERLGENLRFKKITSKEFYSKYLCARDRGDNQSISLVFCLNRFDFVCSRASSIRGYLSDTTGIGILPQLNKSLDEKSLYQAIDNSISFFLYDLDKIGRFPEVEVGDCYTNHILGRLNDPKDDYKNTHVFTKEQYTLLFTGVWTKPRSNTCP